MLYCLHLILVVSIILYVSQYCQYSHLIPYTLQTRKKPHTYKLKYVCTISSPSSIKCTIAQTLGSHNLLATHISHWENQLSGGTTLMANCLADSEQVLPMLNLKRDNVDLMWVASQITLCNVYFFEQSLVNHFYSPLVLITSGECSSWSCAFVHVYIHLSRPISQ